MVCEDECDVRLDPCGHIVVCSKCGQRLKKCPTCKVSLNSGLGGAGLLNKSSGVQCLFVCLFVGAGTEESSSQDKQ